MSLSQENFERALRSAEVTLTKLMEPLARVERDPDPRWTPLLSQISEVDLQKMAWDLEAIQAAIRSEIDSRPGRAEGPVDHA